MSFAIAVGLLVAQGLHSQAASAALSRAEVENAVAKAQELARGDAWPEIDRLLQDRLSQCAAAPAGLDCRPLINYTWAYLREQQARRDPQRQDQLYREAETFYRRVLDDVPDHGPTLNALALLSWRKGRVDDAVLLLHKAIDKSTTGQADSIVALGNILLARGLWSDALKAYESAADAKPTSPLAFQGIVDASRHLPDEQLRTLIEKLPSWEAAYPEAAAAGYRSIVERFASGDPEMAERALLAWTGLLARQRWLNAERINDLYQLWPTTPLDELRTYVEQADFVPQWWSGTTLRRQAITEASVVFGRADILRSGPRAAETRWSRALAELTPEAESYYGPLKGYPLARLDLQTELAALYHQYHELDEGGKFHRLIMDIFNSKFEAYKADDLVAIQRHHTVLGTIYAEEPQWESNDHPALNAVFQLHGAIAAADRRFRNGEAYQPLPRLKEMLAAACEHPGPAVPSGVFRDDCRGPDGNGTVAERYLDAAQGYLDTDELGRAKDMLDRAAHDDGQSARYRDLNLILTGRKAVEQLTDEQIRGDAAAPWSGNTDALWIVQGQLKSVPADFVRRQQFKALSDYAAKVDAALSETPAAQAKLNEVMPLLRDASQSLVPAGTADQLRLEGFRSFSAGETQSSACPHEGNYDVLRLQRALKQLVEPTLAVDGRYGRRTTDAVRAFQAQHGLPVDGVAGDDTKAKLSEVLCR